MPPLANPVLVLPLDARPVCYQQVQQLAASVGLSVLLPPEDLLGVLKTPGNREALLAWAISHRQQVAEAPLIWSVDTVVYGGLIAGRVNEEPLEALQKRLHQFSESMQGAALSGAIAAILRIPHYNNAEEEPDYWATYGEALYAYSELCHRMEQTPSDDDAEQAGIPRAVLSDFLSRRRAHHAINQDALALVRNQQVSWAVFAQDDTGPYGLNVAEARQLDTAIHAYELDGRAHVQTGADEVALTMLARITNHQTGDKPHICPVFYPEASAQVMALFDGEPLQVVVNRQIAAAGGLVSSSPASADIVLYVYGPSTKMGDCCSSIPADEDPAAAQALLDDMASRVGSGPEVALVDVAHANGASTLLSEGLLSSAIDFNQLAGYAAWNTPGNAIGTAVAMSSLTWWAKRQGQFNQAAHNALMLTRLLDDMAYQSDVRQTLRKQYGQAFPPQEALQQAMRPWVERINACWPESAGLAPQFKFPCGRTFEVGMTLS